MEVRPFDPSQTDSVVRFCMDFSIKPHHPERLVRRMLTSLISGPAMILDIHVDSERAAVGALLDLTNNVANSPNFEVLAIHPSIVNPRKVFRFLLDEAKLRLPADRDGIELGYYPNQTPVSAEELSHLGFRPYYQTFEMRTRAPILPPVDLSHWSELDLQDFGSYYSTLANAFAKNVESSVPNADSVLKGLQSKTATLPFVTKVDGRVRAFTTVADVGGVGEVMTVGVHENFRGRGLGREALTKGLIELQKMGSSTFKLSVEAQNENALGLYRSFGFEIEESSQCLKYSRT